MATGYAAEAIRLHAECLAIRRKIGDARGIAFGLSNLPEATRRGGDPDRAAELLEEAGERVRGPALPFGEALVARNRGDVALDRGSAGLAMSEWIASAFAFDAFDALGDDGQLAEAMDRIGAGLAHAGQLRDAVVALSVADRPRRSSGLARLPVDAESLTVATAVVSSLGEITAMAVAAESSAPEGTAPRNWLRALIPQPDPADAMLPIPPEEGENRDAVIITGLIGRETAVLALVAQGLTDTAVGAAPDISAATVVAHFRRICPSLGVINRTAAAQRWLEAFAPRREDR